MSNLTNGCACGFRSFNFRPTPQPAIDCFFMMRANQVFSGCFENVSAQYVIGEIVSPTGVTPQSPYTFVSANSINDMSVVSNIQELSAIPGSALRRYQIDVAVPTELTFTDSANVTFRTVGTVNLRVEVLTPLTYDQIMDSGMPLAVAAIEAVTGSYVSGNIFSLSIYGNIDIIFVCPSLLRLRHEGECSFMPPIGETVTVLSENGNGG